MVGIKNLFAGRSSVSENRGSNVAASRSSGNTIPAKPSRTLIPVKYGGGISQHSTTVLWEAFTWTPATKAKISLVATGNGPSEPPPIEAEHLKAAADMFLPKPQMEHSNISRKANENSFHTELLEK